MEYLIREFFNLSFESQVSVVSVFISAMSLLFAVGTHYKAKRAEIRPNVFISYEKETKYALFREYLVLKNYGKTTAWIKKINIEPELKNIGDTDYLANNFKNIKNFPLAPGQEIKGIIGTAGQHNETLKKEKRTYYIEYKAEGYKKVYKTKYVIDEGGYPTVLKTDTSEDIIKIKESLDGIKKSINKLDKKEKKQTTLL
ncbi:hypothetical protein [Lactococcus petauri]|uniref:hypothetical protein n=1 Tax=Lactococcus petauri TaxID=1940789 RepID=UPI00254B862B|nr:hypothetical protein [Lactococcus petauri]